MYLERYLRGRGWGGCRCRQRCQCIECCHGRRVTHKGEVCCSTTLVGNYSVNEPTNHSMQVSAAALLQPMQQMRVPWFLQWVHSPSGGGGGICHRWNEQKGLFFMAAVAFASIFSSAGQEAEKVFTWYHKIWVNVHSDSNLQCHWVSWVVRLHSRSVFQSIAILDIEL